MNPDRQNNERILLVIGDIILLFCIIFLFTLIKDRNFNLRDGLSRFSAGVVEFIGLVPSARGVLSIVPGNSVRLDPERTFDLNRNILLNNGRYILLNSRTGGFFKFDVFQGRTIKSKFMNEKNISDIRHYQGRYYAFHDFTNRYFIVSAENMDVKPFFFYSSAGCTMVDDPVFSDADSDGVADIIFPDSASHVICLNGRNFTPLWSFIDASDIVWKSPAPSFINNDFTRDYVVASQDGMVYAIDGKSGWLLWKTPAQEKIKDKLYALDVNGDGHDEILFASEEGTIFCLSCIGSILWKMELSEKLLPGLFFADLNRDGKKDLVVFTEKGKLIAYNCLSQTPLWETAVLTAVQDSVIQDSIILQDLNYDGVKDIFFCDTLSFVHALNGRTGDVLGVLKLENNPATRFLARGRVLWYAAKDNDLWCLKFYYKR